jgi:carbon monoxide dehydrogenase subunit G
MKLELTGSAEVDAPREVVWQRLIDPRFVAQSAPGIESVEVLDPTHFRVTSGFGIGRMRARVTLEGALFDLIPDTSARMRMRGTGPGSTIDVLSTIAIKQAGSEKVRLDWTALAELSGPMVKVGARMLEGIAHNLTDQFWIDFARRVAGGEPAGRVL